MGRSRRDMSTRVRDIVMALALCHNVGLFAVIVSMYHIQPLESV